MDSATLVVTCLPAGRRRNNLKKNPETEVSGIKKAG